MVLTVDARFPDATSTGTMPYAGGETWYRVTGEITDDALTPLVVLHGGPGAAHNYTLTMANLSRQGRPVIHYDQFGCGESTHRPDAPPDSWNVSFFVDELRHLVAHLGLTRFHLLGQSWGGMLAPEVVLADDTGVASLTICDSPASMELWLQAANALRAELPTDVQRVLHEHEAAQTTDSSEYAEAMQVFYDRHVCRVVPNPPEVLDTFAQLEAEPTVYHTMNGPSEFHVIGSLQEWSVVERLPDVAVPTLVVAGAYDEATPAVWRPFVDRIPDVRSHVFPESSHMPHVEEPEAFLDVVGDFLSDHDTAHH